MRYEFRRLYAERDLLAFKDGYESGLRGRSGSRLQCQVPLDYLRTSRVIGCWSKRDGRLVGGYVLRNSAPFRAIEAIPAAARADDLCELTCIWRNDGLSTAYTAVLLWPRIITDCVRNDRRYILGIGFDNKMNDVYGRVSPRRIYDGPGASQDLALEVHIYAFTRARIAANFVTNFYLKMVVSPLRKVVVPGRRAATDTAR
jgi:hypothetical protein